MFGCLCVDDFVNYVFWCVDWFFFEGEIGIGMFLVVGGDVFDWNVL